MALLRNTVSALAYSLAAEAAPSESAELAAPYNDVALFLELELARMPDYLRLPMRLLTLAFAVAGVARGGSFFHRNPRGVRLEQVRSWRRARLRACRDFIRFFEGLAVFALYSRLGKNSKCAGLRDYV
ncbi:MAG: hypothetical protein ABIJ96_08015 [Elusimicrobiota bacterium]